MNKGFELNFRGKTITGALQKGSISVIANILVKENVERNELNFCGLNSINKEFYEWFKESMEVGDEFTVKLIDVSKSSEPISTVKERSEFIEEQKLRSYFSLKKELEEKGLI